MEYEAGWAPELVRRFRKEKYLLPQRDSNHEPFSPYRSLCTDYANSVSKNLNEYHYTKLTSSLYAVHEFKMI